ncbi:putative Equilibrative nucleoside transporter 1 [Hypsibius exemplaris]|uniref:Equilibrative nucleoside transporter 1 n=1 Tax=Hypsibius exemplaris TaxID=2072580 RepID=A0A1W0WSN8_HYPEX|nr:putative Equilibrative nucleoside transporter 1 [Hypsibius exemplaris]
MSKPATNLISYRKTGELQMDSPPAEQHYTQSRTLSANRGAGEEERSTFYPDLGVKDGERSPERAALLTPRDKALLAVGGDGELPTVAIVPDTRYGEAPVDRLGFVYMIMLIHGLGTLLPWNVIISSFFYWHYKLDTKLASNGTQSQDVPDTGSFMNYMTLCNQFPNVVLNGLNLIVTFSGSLSLRIVAGISVIILVMVETLILATMNSADWISSFVIITLVSIVLLGTANGIYQNSLYGLAASFPPKYTNAVIIGNNLCGTLVALMGIMSIAVYPNEQHKAGVLYFACAVAILVIAFATYFLLPKSRFYRYYVTSVPVTSPKKVTVGGGYRSRLADLGLVLSQIRLQCWNIFFTFFVTLSVFPGVMLDVKQSKFSFMADQPEYFIPVVAILNFALFAFLGNLIPFACTSPGPKYVWIPVLLRVFFIPFFLFCNYQPFGRERLTASWFGNDLDIIYALGGMLLAVTSGYFSSLTMMFASSNVKDPRLTPIAGQLAGFFLVLGIFCGLMFSRIYPFLITRPATATATDDEPLPTPLAELMTTTLSSVADIVKNAVTAR